eukprot:TRINITY_DN42455_c0_g1_i1.p1 TRINITY_DN42455_c0_g1~~TRINITY_DN42455_c0_g1_i1.p1  ORF type:complete len:1097 (-),score=273.11 TRINITY_DN42455_c0_g1_i1:353-3589(-)
MSLVRGDTLSCYDGGPRQQRQRRCVTVREPAKGFFVAGSSVDGMNGIYAPTRAGAHIGAHRRPRLVYRNDTSGWLLAFLDAPPKHRSSTSGYGSAYRGLDQRARRLRTALGGHSSEDDSDDPENEWVFIDPRGQERLGHKGDTIIPGAGTRWKHLKRGWNAGVKEEVYWYDGREDEYDTAAEDEDQLDQHAREPPSGRRLQAGDTRTAAEREDLAARGALVEVLSDDEDELPWQVIAVLDYEVVHDLRRSYRYYLYQIQRAKEGENLPKAGPAGLADCCDDDGGWIFRVVAPEGVDVKTGPSSLARRREHLDCGAHVRVLERRAGAWLKLAPSQKASEASKPKKGGLPPKKRLSSREDLEEQWVYLGGEKGSKPRLVEVGESEAATLELPHEVHEERTDNFDRPFEPRLRGASENEEPAQASEAEAAEATPAEEAQRSASQACLPQLRSTLELTPGTTVAIEGHGDQQWNGQLAIVVSPCDEDMRQTIRLSDKVTKVSMPAVNLRPVREEEIGDLGRAARILSTSLAELQLAPDEQSAGSMHTEVPKRLAALHRAAERDTLGSPVAAADVAWAVGQLRQELKTRREAAEGSSCWENGEAADVGSTEAPQSAVASGALGLRAALAARQASSDISTSAVEEGIGALRVVLTDEQRRLAREAGQAWPLRADELHAEPMESGDALLLRLTLVRALLRLRREVDALREAREAVRLHPEACAGKFWLARCLLRRAVRTEGVDVLESVVNSDVQAGAHGAWGHSSASSCLGGVRHAEKMQRHAEDAYGYGDFEAAAARYGDALKKLPDDDRWGRAQLLASRAACYRRARKFWKAIEDCDAALALFPRFGRALYRRALALLEADCPAEAIRAFETLLRVDRSWPGIGEWLIRAHAAAKRSGNSTSAGSKSSKGGYNSASSPSSPSSKADAAGGSLDSSDLYAVLGVSSDATEKQLKTAYRMMSLKYHPDKQGGSVHAFQIIAKAYETLSNPDKRRDYDEGADLKKKKRNGQDSSDSEDERQERSLREEIERKYFPERFKFWPFGDPFIEKRKLRARRAQEAARSSARQTRPSQRRSSFYDDSDDSM